MLNATRQSAELNYQYTVLVALYCIFNAVEIGRMVNIDCDCLWKKNIAFEQRNDMKIQSTKIGFFSFFRETLISVD